MSDPTPTIVPPRPIPSDGSLRLRVRYCECDPMGVVHHAAYIPWLEMGRTELLREAGISYAQLESAGVFLVIIGLEVSYKRPGYYDDVLEIRTRVVGGSRVKIKHEYEIIRAECGGSHLSDSGITPGSGAHVGDLLITGASTLACVDRSGRPAALPDWLVPATTGRSEPQGRP